MGPRRERSHRAYKIRVSMTFRAHTSIYSRAPIRYEHGVNTFDTANMYSNGLSEIYLGKAIKELNLPREEIVVMTKVCGRVCLPIDAQAVIDNLEGLGSCW